MGSLVRVDGMKCAKAILFSAVAMMLAGSVHAEYGTQIGLCHYDQAMHPALQGATIQIQSVYRAAAFLPPDQQIIFFLHMDDANNNPTNSVQVNVLPAKNGFQSSDKKYTLVLDGMTRATDGTFSARGILTYSTQYPQPAATYQLECDNLIPSEF